MWLVPKTKTKMVLTALIRNQVTAEEHDDDGTILTVTLPNKSCPEAVSMPECTQDAHLTLLTKVPVSLKHFRRVDCF